MQRPIANEYREGKVKSTPARGVKESLKPFVYSLRKCYGLCGLLQSATHNRVPIEE